MGIGACDNLSNPDRSSKSLRGDTEPEPEQGEPLSLKGRATVGGNGVGLEQAGSVRPVQRTPFPETGLDLLGTVLLHHLTLVEGLRWGKVEATGRWFLGSS